MKSATCYNNKMGRFGLFMCVHLKFYALHVALKPFLEYVTWHEGKGVKYFWFFFMTSPNQVGYDPQ